MDQRIKLIQKKILLLHPLGYKASYAHSDIARKANIMPPLGLASIAAYLEANSIIADIIDCYANPDSDGLIKAYLMEKQPDFVGFSCTSASFLDGVRILSFVKEILPGVKAIFGGPHVSALKLSIVRDYPIIDYVCVGEGEETLRELIMADSGSDDKIKGLVYRNGINEVLFTGYRNRLLDLDTLPFPAYEKLSGFPEKYSLPIFNYPKTPNTSCISSRGCPYACSYCDRSVFKKSFRYNSADYLYRHLEYLKNRFNIRHINFYDDQFTFNRKRVEELMDRLIAKPLGMTFNCAVRAEHIDYLLLKKMKQAGCWMISLGIETGDPDLLAMHRKNADLKMLREKINLIKKTGIRVKGLLMMGLPGESESSIKKSMDYLFSLPVDDFNLAKFTPFPGAPVTRDIETRGTFNYDLEKMDCMHFLFIPNGLTEERLEELFVNFYKKHFLRLRVLWGYLAMVWRSPDSWYRFIMGFPQFIGFARNSSRYGKK